MKYRMLSWGLLAISALIGAALYENGNYVVYILTYVFSFVLLLCHTVFSAGSIREKAAQALIYALILAAQIVFAALVVRPVADVGQHLDPYRLSGVLAALVPFLVRRIWGPQI